MASQESAGQSRVLTPSRQASRSVGARSSGPRIGVFGGAFDPPHAAHVALARAVVVQAELAELRVFPTGQAWHKARALSAAVDRLAMARLAFESIPGVIVDGRETLRTGPTYTLDTLHELQAERPDARLVLLMGTDQAHALPSWHGWRDILSIATILIAVRAGRTGGEIEFDPQSLTDLPSNAHFEWLHLQPVDTSATDIRARVARGEDLASLVPPAVARYIDQHHLYRTT